MLGLIVAMAGGGGVRRGGAAGGVGAGEISVGWGGIGGFVFANFGFTGCGRLAGRLG